MFVFCCCFFVLRVSATHGEDGNSPRVSLVAKRPITYRKEMGNCSSTEDDAVKETIREKNHQMRLRMKERAEFVTRVMRGEATEEEIGSHSKMNSAPPETNRSENVSMASAPAETHTVSTEVKSSESSVPTSLPPPSYPPLPEQTRAVSVSEQRPRGLPCPMPNRRFPMRNLLAFNPSEDEFNSEEEEEEEDPTTSMSPLALEDAEGTVTIEVSHGGSKGGGEYDTDCNSPLSCVHRKRQLPQVFPIWVTSIDDEGDAACSIDSTSISVNVENNQRHSIANSIGVTFSESESGTFGSSSSLLGQQRGIETPKFSEVRRHLPKCHVEGDAKLASNETSKTYSFPSTNSIDVHFGGNPLKGLLSPTDDGPLSLPYRRSGGNTPCDSDKISLLSSFSTTSSRGEQSSSDSGVTLGPSSLAVHPLPSPDSDSAHPASSAHYLHRAEGMGNLTLELNLTHVNCDGLSHSSA